MWLNMIKYGKINLYLYILEDSMEKIEIANGVFGSFARNQRFKNNLITVSFYIKPKENELAPFALVTPLMASGCKEYPTFTLLNRKLDTLYGADIIKSTSMCGDFRVYSLSIKTVDDEFSESGNLEESAKLLCDLCFGYYLDNKDYNLQDLDREKRILSERIAASLNEKRIYATEKLRAIMCEGEPYGSPLSGTVEQVNQVNNSAIKSAFERLLKNAMVDIQFCGKQLPENFFEIFKEKFQKIERRPEGDFSQIVKSANNPRKVTEEMNVAQGKLVMGFRSENVGTDGKTAANLIMSDIFGGGTYSKLFTNVREKMSLCYYCSSTTNRSKGIMFVSSGVESKNIEKAESEILNQFAAMQKGDFDNEVIENSKRSTIGNLNAVNDDLGSFAKWYLNRLDDENPLSPEEWAKIIKNVTKEQIIEAAKSFKLDTVFVLCPKKEEA